MDDTDGTHRIDRRTWLAAGGTALVSLTAGCNSGGSSDGEDSNSDDADGGTGEAGTDSPTAEPAAFTDVTLDVPSSATVREELSVTVSATNTGGRTGTYLDTLRLVEGSRDLEREIEIPEIAPGETGTVEETVTFEFRDEYVFGLAEAEATASVEPEPLRRTVGESLDVRENLRLTLEEVGFEETLLARIGERGYFVDESGYGVYHTPPEEVFALLDFSLENTGSEGDTLPFASVAGPTDAVVERVSFEDDYRLASIEYGEADETQPLVVDEERTLDPGQTVRGWVLLRVPRAEARNGITLRYQANAEATPPEAEFTAMPESGEFSFPSFELVETQIEDTTIERDTDMEVTFTVRNTGDGPGTFGGVLQYNLDRWIQERTAQPNVFTRTIPAGETATFTAVIRDNDTSSDDTYTKRYRFAPFDETFEVTFREPSQ